MEIFVMDSVRKRILREIDTRGLDLKEVSLALGKSHSYMQQFLRRGVPAVLKEQERRKLAEVLGIDEAEIGGPTGGGALMQFRTVPEYDVRVSAGGGALVSDENEVGAWPFNPDYLRYELQLPGNMLGIVTVRGDSMEPTLSSGDRVMVDMSDRQVSQPGIFVLFDGDGTVIKRVEKVPGQSRLVLISDNSRHSRYEVGGDEIQIVGRVVWAAKRF